MKEHELDNHEVEECSPEHKKSCPGVTRRDFIKDSSLAVAGVAGVAAALSMGEAKAVTTGFQSFKSPGLLVAVHKSQALQRLNAFPDAALAQTMVDTALKQLTGKSTVQEAWRSFIHPKDIVGIKPNGIGGRYNSTHKEVIDAVTKGLLSIGVPAENIIVWDQQKWYLTGMRLPNPTYSGDAKPVAGQIRYVHFMQRGRYGRGDFEPDYTIHDAGKSRFCNIIKNVTAVVNLPVIKDHALTGVTCAMKNLAHGANNNPFKFHRRNSDQVAKIYNHPLFKDKSRVIIGDGFRVQYQGGPHNSAHKAIHNTVYATTDPVALDSYAVQLIEMFRQQKRRKPLQKVRRAPTHVYAAEKMGLGVADPAKINLKKITL